MTHDELIKNFFALDGETLEAYARKCMANGYRYTGRFCNGQPVLERLQ